MLRVELEGCNRAHGGGLSADSIMGLARLLMEAGYPDQPFECFRGDIKCLTFKSLAWAAQHTIREEPLLGVVKYKKFSKINAVSGTLSRSPNPDLIFEGR